MNKLYLIAIGALLSGIITVQAQEWKPQQWPVLKKYDKEHLYQIALPLGGIGTGTVSLGGRGELRALGAEDPLCHLGPPASVAEYGASQVAHRAA